MMEIDTKKKFSNGTGKRFLTWLMGKMDNSTGKNSCLDQRERWKIVLKTCSNMQIIPKIDFFPEKYLKH